MEIDYDILSLQLLPTFMRGDVMGALARSLARPLAATKAGMDADHARHCAAVVQTGQTCRLRGLLNDTFDPRGRGIEVRDVGTTDWVYAWREPLWGTLGEPLWVGREGTGGELMLHREGGIATDEAVDFAVVLPPGLAGVDRTRLAELVNRYKLAGKAFVIIN